MPETASPTIDFKKYYSALDTVDLMSCQGYVVRVSGSTVESAGPVLGLGELCGIHVRGGRRVLAEVVGFRHDHLILLPLEHIEGVADVHHAHLWSLDGRRSMITLHARVTDAATGPAIVARIKARLHEKHGIDHATIEIEHGDCADADCV